MPIKENIPSRPITDLCYQARGKDPSDKLLVFLRREKQIGYHILTGGLVEFVEILIRVLLFGFSLPLWKVFERAY